MQNVTAAVGPPLIQHRVLSSAMKCGSIFDTLLPVEAKRSAFLALVRALRACLLALRETDQKRFMWRAYIHTSVTSCRSPSSPDLSQFSPTAYPYLPGIATLRDRDDQAQRSRCSARATSRTGWLDLKIGRVSLQGEQCSSAATPQDTDYNMQPTLRST